jgi:alkylation response protein AidB-like acyl-CoA dehydrogenase
MSSGHEATRSRAVRPRSSRTSLLNACSGYRKVAEMDFNLSDDQREIQATARAFLAARAGAPVVRTAAETGEADAGLWRELCELGWAGIAVDESYGGTGLGLVELCVLLEQHGAALAPTPLLPTACAALVIAAAGSDAQREHWLPGLATGRLLGAVGSTMGNANGGFAAGVRGADVIVMLDGDDASLVTGDSVGIEAIPTVDPLRSYGRVTARGEPLPGDARRAGALALVAIAAELTGLCQRGLDTTVSYVKERRQFGVPVGSFQSVAHRCAEMFLDTESARSAAYYAAWTGDASPDDLIAAATLAKYVSSEAAVDVLASAIQAHGGIGFTWEADIHWWYKRAQLSAQLLGGPMEHSARLGALLATN